MFSRFLIAGLAILMPACSGQVEDNAGTLPLVQLSPIDGKEMVLIPSGEFLMGTDKTDPEKTHLKIGTVKPLFVDQQPERRVHLDAYYIDKYEVTNAEFQRFVDDTQFNDLPAHWVEGKFPEGQASLPVTNVTWREALAYALWAGKRLPTEMQWEKAARGPDGRLYPWGNEYKVGLANIALEGPHKAVPGGTFPQDLSSYGAFDLAGNVMEWTLDWYNPYPGSEYRSAKFGNKLKVLRGNGFQKGGHYFLDAYRYLFYRTEADPDDYFENVGFRCVTDFISTGDPKKIS